MSNFGRSRTVTLDMDMDNAVLEGITLPSIRQTKDGSGMFSFRFFTLSKKYKQVSVDDVMKKLMNL